MIPKDTLLDKAKHIVYEDRAKDYEHPSKSHARTAGYWSAYLGIPVTAKDVCMLMILLKVSREQGKAKEDNILDIQGYAENAWLVDN